MNVLGIFVKRPVPGDVKTRLAATVGAAAAADLYAAFQHDVVSRFRRTADRRFLCHAPDDPESRDFFRRLDPDFALWPQPDASLGDRLQAFFEARFAGGAERVVVIGSDSPTLPAHLVDEAFDRLERSDCVLGPATDGGYYLLGQKGRCRPLFDRVEWSSPHVLARTVERVRAAQARLSLLPPWYDVDTPNDLELLRGHLAAMEYAGDADLAPRTAARLAGDVTADSTSL